jgi:HEAT repeat protein
MLGRTAILKYWPVAVLVGCGFTAIAVLLAGYITPREPAYGGKPLSFWLAQMDGADAGQAQLAIRGIGPKAIPFLFEKVRRDNSRFQRWSRAIRLKLSPATAKDASRPPGDARQKARIVAALRLLEARGLPSIISALDDPDDNVRLLAIAALSSIGPQGSAAVPGLIQRVTDPSPEVRAAAILALRYMGPDKARAVPVLIQSLQDRTLARPDGDTLTPIQDLAAQVLGKIGPPARPALPCLSALLTETNASTRHQAILALWRIDHDTNLVELAVRETAVAHEDSTRKRFLEVLGEMGPAARPAVPVILSLITNAPSPAKSSPTSVPAAARSALRRVDPSLIREIQGIP